MIFSSGEIMARVTGPGIYQPTAVTLDNTASSDNEPSTTTSLEAQYVESIQQAPVTIVAFDSGLLPLYEADGLSYDFGLEKTDADNSNNDEPGNSDIDDQLQASAARIDADIDDRFRDDSLTAMAHGLRADGGLLSSDERKTLALLQEQQGKWRRPAMA
jgi:hypothetical protein